MYSIEELEETFREHHKRSLEINEELLKQFQENNPGEPIPDWYNQKFSLPLAMASICKEILKLKY